MKTIPQIKKEIDSIKQEIEDGVTVRQEKKLRKQIPFFRSIILYLEKDPSEDYLKNELKSIKTKSAKILERYDGPLGKLKTAFKKEYGVDKMEAHIKSLQYILN